LHFIASHGNTFFDLIENVAQEIPPGSRLALWVGMGMVWVWHGEKTRRWESFLCFLSFVIDTSQLHYSLGWIDVDEALASFSSINQPRYINRLLSVPLVEALELWTDGALIDRR
jgi:hypothetical protein